MDLIGGLVPSPLELCVCVCNSILGLGGRDLAQEQDIVEPSLLEQ